MTNSKPLADRILEICADLQHQSLSDICGILAEPSGKSSSGYPYISSHAFQTFLARIPHLFEAGLELATWTEKALTKLANSKDLNPDEKLHVTGTLRVIDTIINTAAVTSPTDLWLLRHVLSVFDTLKLIHRQAGNVFIELPEIQTFHVIFIKASIDFLISRKLIENVEKNKYAPASHAARLVLQNDWVLKESWKTDQVPLLLKVLRNESSSAENLDADSLLSIEEAPRAHLHWMPSKLEIELGFRILPLLLALRIAIDNRKVIANQPLPISLNGISNKANRLLQLAGILDAKYQVTALGQRVFSKGPGPFGIIYAYHSYMKNLEKLLTCGPLETWVERSANVAASQEANRKTFELANENLDHFCEAHGFSYSIFIEHAVGQGEATRQRYLKSGDSLRYFGADLEPEAIAAAKKKQAAGELPAKMKFVDNADIGNADVLLLALNREGANARGAVMVVGNGFHEVRNQSDEGMIAVFKAYCNAGIVLIFTEESGLSNEDLTRTGWNTYHAGFRYVHELSGQGLRPAFDTAEAMRLSWKKCAENGGYRVLDKYSPKTRTIYPHPRPDGKNPSISVTYFCVPKDIAVKLNLTE